MAVPFSFLSRGYRESLHQKNYYSLLLLIGNSVSTHCMAVPFSFLSRGYRESLHQKNYYSLLLLIGNSDI